MSIEYIRLENFKGFKSSKLNLKPLTILIGPNSAGKSTFGQALVALSKAHRRGRNLSLSFDRDCSTEFGTYEELVCSHGSGGLVKIELGLKSGPVVFGFGKGDPERRINDLEIQSLVVPTPEKKTAVVPVTNLPEDSSTTVATTTIPTSDLKHMSFGSELLRNNEKNWSIGDRQFKVFFNGINIEAISHLTGTAVELNEILSEISLSNASNLVDKVSYLRPDRVKPARYDKYIAPCSGPEIDDWGRGTSNYLFEYANDDVVYFDFPAPTPDKDDAFKALELYERSKPQVSKLSKAVTWWLNRLGLAKDFDTKQVASEDAIQALATPIGQGILRPLSDLGFGISQVLPIIVKGLTLEEEGTLVVEQPEAQLHPRPQAELADFFCSMVKCKKKAIVETHSIEFFHRLRYRASMDSFLKENIAVYFIDESCNDACCDPKPISLSEDAELKWPKGFLPNGINAELEILAMRLAKKERKS